MLIDSNETTYVSLLHSSPSKTETGHAQFILATTMVRGSEPMSETPNGPLVHPQMTLKLSGQQGKVPRP